MKCKRAHDSSHYVALAVACGLGACATLALAAGPAGVKLDGTLGGSAATLTGPTYNITQSLGQLAGGNLFFSFQYFNILTNQTALFATTSGGINNVISRVTGGYASTIDGQIKLVAASGAPDFYFINPSGVTFTANASINVPAAFAVTTANYLKFADGNFYADPTKASTLSTMAPEAFGFLGTTRAPVNIEGAQLSAAGGSGDFQIVAGDVTVDGGDQSAQIAGGSGNIRVIATGAQTTEVPLTGVYTSNDGTVSIQNGGVLATTGGNASAAGGIYVSAATLQVNGDNSANRTGMTSAAGPAGAGPISINVTGSALITSGGNIISYPGNGGTGGAITVNAGSLSIDGGASTVVTGIGSSAYAGLSGNAGNVSVTTTGATTLSSNGEIGSVTFGSGNAGDVTLAARSLSIEGGGTSTALTGISSSAYAGSSGNAGNVTVTTAEAATLSSGGAILSSTGGSGNAGDVTLSVGSLSIDGVGSGIGSSAASGSTGNAGNVTVGTIGATTLSNGGQLQSATFGQGGAGNITVVADSLSIIGNGNAGSAGISNSAVSGTSGNAGKVTITTAGATALSSGGVILSSTGGAGNAGDITLSVGSLSIAGGGSGISTAAVSGSSGNAGQVTVTTTGATTLASGGVISSDAYSVGKAGNVNLNVGSLNIDGGAPATGTGISSSSSSSGSAGNVVITTTGAATLTSGGAILSASLGTGNAGDVTVTAGSLSIDAGSSTMPAEISSSAQGLSGNAGRVTVTTTGSTTLSSGGQILSATSGLGNAGDVTLTAGSLGIDGGTSTLPTDISSSAKRGSSGNAGTVTVATTGATTISSGGQILSDTFGPGKAGYVTVTANSLSIDGGDATVLTGISSAAESGSSGNAGQVTVSTAGATTIINNGEIESATFASGSAGSVTLNAGSLNIAGGGPMIIATGGGPALTGISSAAETGSSGNAGQVNVATVGATTLSDGAKITSTTQGSGNAGDVTLTAGSLSIDGGTSQRATGISTAAGQGSGSAGIVGVNVSGTVTLLDGGVISSRADSGSRGQPGTIEISAGNLDIGANGLITIENDSRVANPTGITPTQIDLHAGTIQMGGGQITAASTGNIAASSIDISYQQTLHLDPSSITTTSNQGDGGPITITGQGLLWQENSSITTSVLGTTNGNGGDIHIKVPYIVLDSGVIQANTTAPKASGGNVVISAQALIPSFEFDVLGGSIVSFNPATLGQNVVQAAAPDGVSGTLDVTKPTLDLGSALLGLTGTPSTPIALSRSLCNYRRGSSLAIAGRGGLPVSYRDPLWIDLGEENVGAATGNAPRADRSVSGSPRFPCRN